MEINTEELMIWHGESLKQYVKNSLIGISKMRYIGKILHKYIESSNDRKVCCLYGLRRTGKTVMMLQEIDSIKDYDSCLFIECGEGNSMMQVRHIIEKYPKVKYIFIDEATKMKNFINTASVLADKYASNGKKVIIAGTDSLGFFFAKSDELYDRVHMIHTTYVSFSEQHYLLGKSLMDYIRYGGTLSPENVFYNRDSLNEYSNSAIVFNIVHSLERWNQGRNNGILEEYVNNGDLPSFINKVIEYDNRLFLAKIINKDFESHDLGSLADLLTKSGNADPEIIYPSGSSLKEENQRKEVNNRIRIFLHIKDDALKIDDKSTQLIIDYLKFLDVLYEIPKLSKGVPEYIFTQPGMRYSQATDLSKALVTSDVFVKRYSFVEKQEILDKIEQDICGGILEDIILYQTIQSFTESEKGDYFISKYRQESTGKEFDVIILDVRLKKSTVIEVKLSNKRNKNQIRHLVDKDFCNEFEAETGTKIVSKVVIYSGESITNTYLENENRVIYLNAEDYLINTEATVKKLCLGLI